MEPRCLLASGLFPVNIGAVYYEDASGVDEAGDLFEVTFNGGAPGTQLAELEIRTDKTGDGLTIGDVFFDTDSSGLGAYGAAPLEIIEQTGIDSVNASVADGQTTLWFSFTGFDPGDRLVFSIDVDEQGFLGPNAVAEGNELEGSQLVATFTAPHCYDSVGSDIFLDHFQQKLDDSGLDLPPDVYVPPGETPTPVRTAAAVFPLAQTLLPITISGTVFEDVNLNNTQDPGELGLAGVKLTLMELQEAEYLATGETAVTDADGNYVFEGVLPGTYRVVETQPDGFYSIGASAGSVGGVQRGIVTSADVISGLTLLGGEDSVDNDFAEARPAALSGNVYHDADNDGVLDAGETGIGGVFIQIQYLPPTGPPPMPIEATTATDGSWSVDGLMPGDYCVEEVQPDGYFDGLDAAGTAGGTAHNPGDRIDSVRLQSGQLGQEYNFGELVPNSISGRVIVDANGNCLYDPGETLLAGVTVLLRDGSDSPPVMTKTDAQGQYAFTLLRPGVYSVEEIQPEGYCDGGDHVGSAAGALSPPDSIVGIELVSGTAGVGYDFCELEPASISGFVYVDENNNGIREIGEAGIPSVELTLLDEDGQPTPLTAVTDVVGFYSFQNLTPLRAYVLAETQPKGFLDGLDTPGTAGGLARDPGDSIAGVFLPPGAQATDYNFGELRPPPPGEPEPEIPTQPPPAEPVPDDPTGLPPAEPNEPVPVSPPVYLPTASPPSFSPPSPLFPQSPLALMRPAAPVAPVVQFSSISAPSAFLPLHSGGGGGSRPDAWYAWHLSVVNGGRPRHDSDMNELDRVAAADGVQFHSVSWTTTDMDESQWTLADDQGQPVQQFQFGLVGGTPVAGDWNGDGMDEIGVFLDGLWFLDLNGNGTWDEDDLWIRLGSAADTPVVGDWDGDGKTDIGVFGTAWPGDHRAIAAEPGLPDVANAPTGRYKNVPPSPDEATAGYRTMKRTSQGNLRADVIDHVFQYGRAGDVAVAGDWNGDGVTNIAIFRDGSWYLDVDGNGRWSSGDIYVEKYGAPGDLPVVGDFNCDGIDDLGVYRDGTWYLDADGDRTLTARDKVFELGGPHEKPVVGDFDGDGIDEVATYRAGVTAPDSQAADAWPTHPREAAASPSRPISR